ncbi:hypothetical protein J437_LFUL013247 [Ladona fulva]|uniref:Uncharacterized protein n=1 Tax=Ladona fulva TaxID=123851 RepID=A0A8K0KHJ1_LADFU|nr:hypothetical protein J437_LFUL013247 [Ladona fulva]
MEKNKKPIPSSSGICGKRKRSNEEDSRKTDEIVRLLMEEEEAEDVISTNSDSEFEVPDDEGSSSDDDEDTDISCLTSSVIEPEPVPTAGKPIVWCCNKLAAKDITFSGRPGLKAGSPGSRPFDYFNLFANEEFFKLLETETNINGRNKKINI